MTPLYLEKTKLLLQRSPIRSKNLHIFTSWLYDEFDSSRKGEEIIKAFFNKILWINLKARTSREETIPDSVYKTWEANG